jgi:hypothetical protein
MHSDKGLVGYALSTWELLVIPTKAVRSSRKARYGRQ